MKKLALAKLVRRIVPHALYPFLAQLCYDTSNAQAVDYHYSPYEKPDPFDPSLLLKSTAEGFHPLQKSPLKAMTLVGTIIGQRTAAMILAPSEKNEKRTYIVSLGDRLGSSSGTVIAILADRIIVREPIEREGNSDFAKFQDTALVLRTRENADSEVLSLNPNQNSQGTKKPLIQALTEDLVHDTSSSMSLYTIKGKTKIENYNSLEVSDLKKEVLGAQRNVTVDSLNQTQTQSQEAPLQTPSIPQGGTLIIQPPSESTGSISLSTGSISTEIRSINAPPANPMSGGVYVQPK